MTTSEGEADAEPPLAARDYARATTAPTARGTPTLEGSECLMARRQHEGHSIIGYYTVHFLSNLLN